MATSDEAAQTKLQHLIQQFGVPKALLICQLNTSDPGRFSEQLAHGAAERSMPPMGQQTRNHREMTQ